MKFFFYGLMMLCLFRTYNSTAQNCLAANFVYCTPAVGNQTIYCNPLYQKIKESGFLFKKIDNWEKNFPKGSIMRCVEWLTKQKTNVKPISDIRVSLTDKRPYARTALLSIVTFKTVADIQQLHINKYINTPKRIILKDYKTSNNEILIAQKKAKLYFIYTANSFIQLEDLRNIVVKNS